MGIPKWINILRIFLFSITTTLVTCIGVGVVDKNENVIYEYLPPTEVADEPRPETDFLEDIDIYNDSLREADHSFNYKTLLDTTLRVQLVLYDLHYIATNKLTKKVSADYQVHGEAKATVRIRNSKNGKVIFSGKTNESGLLTSTLILPSHIENCELLIYQKGFHNRTASIKNITAYATIDRTMSLGSNEESASNTLTDRDGDLIADIYDAFPDDPIRAFKNTIPADESLTIAFEDIFPGLGDGDYNDFIARYTVHEILNADNKLLELTGSAQAIARVAGYDHRFAMNINFTGEASLTTKYHDYAGNVTSSSTQAVSKKANVVFFEHTKQAFTRLNGGSGVDNGYDDRPHSEGHTASFSLTFAEPLNRFDADFAPFDPYLYIHNTGYDVHLIGKPALPDTNNPEGSSTSFRDANGYPRALLVPTVWAYPKESKAIEQAYSNFSDWRVSLGQSGRDWYLYPNEDHVIHPASQIASAPAVALPAGTNVSELVIAKFAINLPNKLGYHFVPIGEVYDIYLQSGQTTFPDGEYASITYSYDKDKLQARGLIEEFQGFYYNDTLETWQLVDKITVDSASQSVTVLTSHLTPFVLTALPTPHPQSQVPAGPSCIEDDIILGGTAGAEFSVLGESFKYYQDRDYFIQPASQSANNAATFATLGLQGALGISTCNGFQGPATWNCGNANLHKWNTDTNYISFTAHTDIDVFVLYDTYAGVDEFDVSGDAAWLAAKGFTPLALDGTPSPTPALFLETTLGSSKFTVYKKTYTTGQLITLDGNRNNAPGTITTNYWVAIKIAGDTGIGAASDLCLANPDLSPPPIISNLTAYPGDNEALLTWNNPSDPDLVNVILRRSTASQPTIITDGEAITGIEVTTQRYQDQGLSNDTTYYYTIFSLDSNNNYQLGSSAVVIPTATAAIPELCMLGVSIIGDCLLNP